MLDFKHVLNTPGADIQYFEGSSTVTLTQWQVWKKPRGAKFVYMIGVGGGGGGSCGNAAAVTTGGGGAGGSSGGQSTVMIPAMFVPDTLYIEAGAGGAGATTSAGFGVVGQPTYVCISPYTTIAPAGTFLLANGGTVSATAPTTSNGGLAPGAVAAATIVGMCLAGRGFFTQVAGQVGGAGGAANASGPTVNLPTTGLMVTGGSGGGGVGSGNGGTIFFSGSLGGDFLPILSGGTFGGGSPTPGNAGFIARNFLMNYGGTGGAAGGSGQQGTAGGAGAPGSGGGGGGGASNSFPTIAPAGRGGPGFVYIITT